MPKVYLSEEDRRGAKLASWVYGELKVRHMTQADLARQMGITHQAVSIKLKRHSFSYKDFLMLIAIFEPPMKEIEWLVRGSI